MLEIPFIPFIPCARSSLADLATRKEVVLPIARTAGSQAGVMGSNSHGEALRGEHVSRSASEPEVASLWKTEAASPRDRVKPASDGEATSRCTHRASRGGNGQHAWTDRSRNLGDPAGCRKRQRRKGMHNLSNGLGWESDRPIVAGKRVTTVERRGLTVDAPK